MDLTTTSNVPDAPDWSTLQREIACPLCDYNLRGLTEPRCPECGHRFDWKDVLDEQNRVHPYLFEHHPERNVRSFVRTLLGSVLPRSFWRDIRPTHRPNPTRLLTYWAVSALPILLLFVTMVTISVVQQVRDIQQQRDALIYRARYRYGEESIVKTFGSLEAYAAATWPMPPISRMVRQHSLRMLHTPLGCTVWFVLGWPWLSVAALSIYRISMRRKRIVPSHVVRCVVYAADGMFWFGLFASGVLVYMAMSTSYSRTAFGFAPTNNLAAKTLPIAAICLIVVMIYRLSVAYRRYLRFDHPEGTVILAQIIVLLAFWKLVLVMNGL